MEEADHQADLPTRHLKTSAAEKPKYREHDDDDQDDHKNAERWPPSGVGAVQFREGSRAPA